jgi:hypothetical protein
MGNVYVFCGAENDRLGSNERYTKESKSIQQQRADFETEYDILGKRESLCLPE